MIRRLVKGIVGFLCMVFGIYLFLYTDLHTLWINYHTKLYIDEFENIYEENDENTKEKDSTQEKKNNDLYKEIVAYNQAIYEKNQMDFNAESLKKSPINSSALMDEKFGYIEIPTLNITFPLYLGASDKNMARGLAVMGQTSVPIGGTNTNSVISGHRGWNTGNFLRDIEKVKIGDCIYITNPWEQLVYKVIKIDIVSPYDSEALLIQEGKDLVTIMTCHPYASHGKYRYLLYCERTTINEKETQTVEESQEDSGYIIASDGTVYESSDEELKKEELLKKFCGGLIVSIVLFYFSIGKIRKR